jgi:hypothetical protein
MTAYILLFPHRGNMERIGERREHKRGEEEWERGEERKGILCGSLSLYLFHVIVYYYRRTSPQYFVLLLN